MRSRGAVTLLLVLLLSITFSIPNENENSVYGIMDVIANDPMPDTEPFMIENESSLLENASLYGWPGSGSEVDPFIISNMVIDANQTYYGISLQNISSSLHLRNITITNASSYYNGIYACLQLTNSANIVISQCHFTDSNYGIYSQNSSITISNSTIDFISLVGIEMWRGDLSVIDSVLKNCTAYSIRSDEVGSTLILRTIFKNGNQCLLADNSDMIKMVDSTLDNFLSFGIQIQVNKRTILDNATLYNVGTGASINGAGSIDIIDCNFDQTNTGIYILYSSNLTLERSNLSNSNDLVTIYGTINSTIQDNEISKARDGILSYFCTDTTIKSNNISNMTRNGIYSHMKSGDMMIKDNVINDCSTSLLIYQTRDMVLGSNIINRPDRGCRVEYSTNVTVKDLKISKATDIGIQLRSLSDSHIENNEVYDSGTNSIYISDSENCNITGNFLYNGLFSIEVQNSDDLAITDNMIINSQIGLIGQSMDRTDILSNEFISSSSYGIHLVQSSHDTIYGNLFLKGRSYGVNLQTSTDNMIYNNTFAYNNGASDVYKNETAQCTDNMDFNYWSNNGFGNHWNDWTSPDDDEDGIVDLPYKLYQSTRTDEYPLTEPLHPIVPSKPMNLSLIQTNTSIILTWKEPVKDGSSAVSGYSIYRSNGTKFLLLETVGNSPLSYMDTDIEEGITYQYKIKAINSVGDSLYSNTVSGFMDNTDPKVKITLPASGSYLNSEQVLVKWTINDKGENVKNSSYSLDGEEWMDVGKATMKTITVTEEGSHHIRIRVHDTNGNWNITGSDFTLDKTSPEIEIIDPVHGEWSNRSSLTFQWTGSDEISAIDHFEIRWDNIYWIPKGLNTATVINGLSKGQHILYAKAIDLAGNERTVTSEIMIDFDQPTIEITSPIEGLHTNSDSIEVAWIGSDPSDTNLSYIISVDEGPGQLSNTSSFMSVAIEDEGYHTIKVTVMDRAGNRDSDTINVTIDRTAPKLNEKAPSENEVVELYDEIFVIFNEEMDVNEVQIKLKGVFTFINWYGNKAVVSLDGDLLPGRTYTVTVTGADLAGNRMEGYQWSFTTNSSASIMGIVYDANNLPIQGVALTIGSSTIATTDSSGHFHSLIDPGQYDMILEREGYTRKTRTFTIDSGEIKDFGIIRLDKEQNMGTVHGKVVDGKGKPINGVIVNTNTGFSDTTDEEGIFSIELEEGDHVLTFSRDLFKSVYLNVTISSGENVDLGNIEMVSSVDTEESDEEMDIFQIQIIVFMVILIIGIIAIWFLFRKNRGTSLEEE